MDPKLPILLAGALLLGAPVASASHFSNHFAFQHDALGGPTGADLGLAHAAASYCTDGALADHAAIFGCGLGLGATIDLSPMELGGDWRFAYGTCAVSQDPNNYNPFLEQGSFSFLCGVDRDDDGLVTNVDQDGSGDPDGFDDDFAWGHAPTGTATQPASGTADVCFRSEEVPGSPSDPYEWDTMHVFVEASLQPDNVPSDIFRVQVDLYASSLRDVCLPLQASGHTHTDWHAPSADRDSWCAFEEDVTDSCVGLMAVIP